MNIYISLIKECSLVAAFLMVFSFMGQATTTTRIFKARQQTNLVRSLNTQLIQSDTIPLQSMSGIFALSIDATITQPYEDSFVRIVLEDTEGHDYLVAESDRFRNDTAVVHLSEYCEETALLQGVTPYRLKCYLAGDVTLTITGIHTSNQEPTRGETNTMETSAIIKEAQVQDIVNRINEYNIRHGKLWIAGATDIAMMRLSDKIKTMDADISTYTYNIEYYTGGIFEFGEPAHSRNWPPVSPYVEAFDWCDRHGKNWITPIRDQRPTPYCTAFAVAAGVEAMRNLYYNMPIMDSLSVQEIACCAKYNPKPDSLKNINVDSALIYSRDVGIMLDSIYPFEKNGLQICMSDEKEPDEKFKINNYTYWQRPSVDSLLRNALIHNGPQVCWINAMNRFNHAMLLVGYGQIQEGMILNIYEHFSPHVVDTILVGDNRIGKTYWKFKNSWGVSNDNGCINGIYDGYMYIIMDDPSIIYRHYSILTPITSELLTDADIIVEDSDGDGYFNWGIGLRPNGRLPTWAELEEDGDDSNHLKGPMNGYGFLTDNNYDSILVVDHNMTDSELFACNGGHRFLRRDIKLNPGVTLTIQGNLAFYAGRCIYMRENSTLKIDGGILVDPTLIKSGDGCNVKIINGGEIQLHKKQDFNLPEGISMEMDEGSIFN